MQSIQVSVQGDTIKEALENLDQALQDSSGLYKKLKETSDSTSVSLTAKITGYEKITVDGNNMDYFKSEGSIVADKS